MDEPGLFFTEDGSHSLHTDNGRLSWHSKHGAIGESRHVYINAGFKSLPCIKLSVFEMGFGTGLNALLTYIEAERSGREVTYETIEQHPIPASLYSSLNYCNQLQRPDLLPIFKMMHETPWDNESTISPFFRLIKRRASMLDFRSEKKFNLVYFDAFAPSDQPELWTKDVFARVSSFMYDGSVLVTYSAKGEVRRNLLDLGFVVERLPGYGSKREMLRATFKNSV
jgi:tRNA U34 5-methylaminomethyl-2-thiouridine-forming methyltransferase MnmC